MKGITFNLHKAEWFFLPPESNLSKNSIGLKLRLILDLALKRLRRLIANLNDPGVRPKPLT